MPSPVRPSMGPPTTSVSPPYPKISPHPHDQHIRHNTHDISARGGRRRSKPEDAPHPNTKQTRNYKSSKYIERRDDFNKPVFSIRYCDSMLQISPDRLSCTGYKGWSSVFCTHCAEKGKWYFEAKILQSSEPPKFLSTSSEQQPKVEAHVRVGWACRYQRYDLPVSHNIFGYAIGDVDGSVFNGAVSHSYASKNIEVGDVIGCYLHLNEPSWWPMDPRKDRKLYEFLQAGILCNPKEPPSPVPNVGSFISFSINGERFGKAFEEIHNGSYHPVVSLYMGAKVRVEFGPDFEFPPDDGERWRPACEMMRPFIP